MDKQELIDFENNTVELFNDGQLKSPIHLSGSIDGKLEDWLIELFKEIKKEDWCFTTYRSHYHALLKGMPKERLLNWIKDNKSIHVMDKEYKIFSSAIVGGCLSIALGVAMAIKINTEKIKKELEKITGSDFAVTEIELINRPHVWIFCGDMTANSGQFYECFKYADNFDLPITFIIEDNSLSTDTDTKNVWGQKNNGFLKGLSKCKKIRYIQYERKYPHYGSGKFITKLWDKEDVKGKGF
jgi:pyruvate dehydrogenase E1 component alpha subunit